MTSFKHFISSVTQVTLRLGEKDTARVEITQVPFILHIAEFCIKYEHMRYGNVMKALGTYRNGQLASVLCSAIETLLQCQEQEKKVETLQARLDAYERRRHDK